MVSKSSLPRKVAGRRAARTWVTSRKYQVRGWRFRLSKMMVVSILSFSSSAVVLLLVAVVVVELLLLLGLLRRSARWRQSRSLAR